MIVFTVFWKLVTFASNRKQQRAGSFFNFVDLRTVDLDRDVHVETNEDAKDDLGREARLAGRWRWLWRMYYILA